MMPAPKFVFGLSELQFTSNLSYPLVGPEESPMLVDRDNSGALVIEDTGITPIKTIQMLFNRMNSTDYAALREWVVNTVRFSAEEFEYIDEVGTSYTVRIVDDSFNFSQIRYGVYSGTITLEKTA